MTEDVVARQEIKALKELVEALRAADQIAMRAALAAQQLGTQAALDAAKEAVLKAENASEKRFEAVNEFRATLADQARDLATKVHVDARFDAINETLKRLDHQSSSAAGRSTGAIQLWGFIIGGAGVLIAIAVALFK